MKNRPYQVVMQRIDRDTPSYIRYFTDFKTAYSVLRYHILHTIYYVGFVKYVGIGSRCIVFMEIKGDCCYRWFGKKYVFHPSEVFLHHKSLKFLVGDSHE